MTDSNSIQFQSTKNSSLQWPVDTPDGSLYIELPEKKQFTFDDKKATRLVASDGVLYAINEAAIAKLALYDETPTLHDSSFFKPKDASEPDNFVLFNSNEEAIQVTPFVDEKVTDNTYDLQFPEQLAEGTYVVVDGFEKVEKPSDGSSSWKLVVALIVLVAGLTFVAHKRGLITLPTNFVRA